MAGPAQRDPVDGDPDVLAKADPEGPAKTPRTPAAYRASSSALDRAIARCMDGIPASDAASSSPTTTRSGYFAERYGIEVLGSVIPALSTTAQPSAGEVRDLVDAIRARGRTTIFPETALSPEPRGGDRRARPARRSARRCSRTRWGPRARGGDLPAMLRFNAQAIAEGFSDGVVRCELPRTAMFTVVHAVFTRVKHPRAPWPACPRSSSRRTASSSTSSRRPPATSCAPPSCSRRCSRTSPSAADLAREIMVVEQEGDRITHDILHRLNQTFVTPIDREDILELRRRSTTSST